MLKKIAYEKNLKLLNDNNYKNNNNNNTGDTKDVVAENLNKNLKQNIDLISALKQKQETNLNKTNTIIPTVDFKITPPPPPPPKNLNNSSNKNVDNIFNKFNKQAQEVSSDSVVAEFKNKLAKINLN